MSGGSPNPSARRILALVLPDLLVELALRQRLLESHAEAPKPLGVVLLREPEHAEPEQLSLDLAGRSALPEEELPASTPLAAVNREAERFGVRPQQTIAEASALVAHLVVMKVRQVEVERALAGLCEVALGYGATVALAAPDTVWVDITGSAHLFGGEEALALDLAERVRELGHRVKVAVSAGPELARAFARWLPPSRRKDASAGIHVIAPSGTVTAAADLPIQALPLGPDNLGYLLRLGLLTWAELSRQPRAALAPRLGKEAARVLELCSGQDNAPLAPYQPPRTLEEESSWDDAVSGTEPLGFVLRGLAARISARLCARGEAAEVLDVTLLHDPVIARFRGVPAQTVLHFKLSEPLHREADLRRIVASRLERLTLQAPSLGMKLTVPRLTPMVSRQLSLSELMAGDTARGERDLPGDRCRHCARHRTRARVTTDHGRRVCCLRFALAGRSKRAAAFEPAPRELDVEPGGARRSGRIRMDDSPPAARRHDRAERGLGYRRPLLRVHASRAVFLERRSLARSKERPPRPAARHDVHATLRSGWLARRRFERHVGGVHHGRSPRRGALFRSGARVLGRQRPLRRPPHGGGA